jgi:hypothetical protein
VAAVTAVEIDADLAADLKVRLAGESDDPQRAVLRSLRLMPASAGRPDLSLIIDARRP